MICNDHTIKFTDDIDDKGRLLKVVLNFQANLHLYSVSFCRPLQGSRTWRVLFVDSCADLYKRWGKYVRDGSARYLVYLWWTDHRTSLVNQTEVRKEEFFS